MKEHERNAHAVATFLEEHDDIASVYYPGLPSHPQHELAKRQMHGFGGMVSFKLRGAARRARSSSSSTPSCSRWPSRWAGSSR